jgi:hypothetical protein
MEEDDTSDRNDHVCFDDATDLFRRGFYTEQRVTIARGHALIYHNQ